MNCTTYIFGVFNTRYTQYPDDYSVDILSSIREKHSAETMLCVHRDNNLMYYSYVRTLEDNRYVGFSIVLNDVMFTSIKKVFSLFENFVANITVRGELIQFKDDGNITSTIDKLYEEQNLVEILQSNLKDEFQKLESDCQKLPNVNYSISRDEEKFLPYSETEEEIVKTTYSYSNTYVFKNEDYDALNLGSYRGILRKLNERNEELLSQNNELQEELSTTIRKKEQITKVIVLGVILAVCVIVLYAVFLNLNTTKSRLLTSETELAESRDAVDELSNNNSNLRESLSDEREAYVKLQDEYNRLKKLVNPVIITKLELLNTDIDGDIINDDGETFYATRMEYLAPKIEYASFSDDSSVSLHFVLKGPLEDEYDREINIQKGEGLSYTFAGRGFRIWYTGEYTIEIWYNSACIASRKFSIY